MKTLSRSGLTPDQRLAVVRGIVEGTHPTRKVLRCIPVQTLVVPPAPAERLPAMEQLAAREKFIGISEAMDLYRRQNPGMFTTDQCWQALAALRHPTSKACLISKFRNLIRDGHLVQVSGRQGVVCRWQFINP